MTKKKIQSRKQGINIVCENILLYMFKVLFLERLIFVYNVKHTVPILTHPDGLT